MNRKRFISGLLAAAVLMGAAACDRNAGRDLPADTSDDIAGVEDTAVTDGTIKVTIAETGSGDASGDAGAGTDAITDKGTDTDTDSSGKTDVTTAGLPAPTAEYDPIVFMYTYTNMAWGYDSRCMLVTASGEVYVFSDSPVVSMMHNGRDIELEYLKEYSEPAWLLDREDIEELYDVCCEVAPDVETDKVHVAYDCGEYRFTCIEQETGREITVFIDGDYRMETDDPTLKKAQELSEKLLSSIGGPRKDIKLNLYSHCISAPYGGTELIGTHLVFDSFDKLVKYCEENGIELDADAAREQFEEASYIMLQVFDTDQRLSGALITDDEVLQLLPSLEAFEYDPAYDGKVGVGMWRFEGFEEGRYVDENGDPWVLYG